VYTNRWRSVLARETDVRDAPRKGGSEGDLKGLQGDEERERRERERERKRPRVDIYGVPESSRRERKDIRSTEYSKEKNQLSNTC